jgi:hypothetical protein
MRVGRTIPPVSDSRWYDGKKSKSILHPPPVPVATEDPGVFAGMTVHTGYLTEEAEKLRAAQFVGAKGITLE